MAFATADRGSASRQESAVSVRVHRLPFDQVARPEPWTMSGIVISTLAGALLYSLLVPLALLDVWILIYQAICGRLLGIAPVRRRDYFTLDRHKLPYLNALEKVNCVYCGYATGLIAFVAEVAARTEQYWCPIKHAAPTPGRHPRHRRFAAYGDELDYRRRLPHLRGALARTPAAARDRKERP
jgi:hypothetical protein